VKKKTRKKLFRVFEFFLRFTLLALPLYIIMGSGVQFFVWEKLIADQVSFVISGFAEVNQTVEFGMSVLSVEGFEARIGIDSSCTGYRSMLAFIALVFAVPGVDWKKRLKPLVPGFMILYAVNLFRIIITISAGVLFGFRAFELMHLFLWRWALTLAILGMWFYWLKKEVLTKNP